MRRLPDQDPANFVVPPDGWSLPSSAPDVVAAFRVLDGRVAAVQDGTTLQDQIAARLAADAPRAGEV